MTACSQSGRSGSGIRLPENTIMNGPTNVFTPRSESVATTSVSMSVDRALERHTTRTIDNRNNADADAVR